MLELISTGIANPTIREYDGEPWIHMCRSPEDMVIIVSGGNNAGVSCIMTPWGYLPPPGEIMIRPINRIR